MDVDMSCMLRVCVRKFLFIYLLYHIFCFLPRHSAVGCRQCKFTKLRQSTTAFCNTRWRCWSSPCIIQHDYGSSRYMHRIVLHCWKLLILLLTPLVKRSVLFSERIIAVELRENACFAHFSWSMLTQRTTLEILGQNLMEISNSSSFPNPYPTGTKLHRTDIWNFLKLLAQDT